MATILKPAITLPIAGTDALLHVLTVKTDTGAVYRIALSSFEHSSFGGLTDDDHPHYHTDSRADSWLESKTITDLGGIDLGVLADRDVLAYDNVSGKWKNIAISGLGFLTLADLTAHVDDLSNPHLVTAVQVGAPPTGRTITAGTALTGGGDLSADRTLHFDLTELTEETLADPDADYGIIFKQSAGDHRKVRLRNWPGGAGGGSGAGGGVDGGNSASEWFAGVDGGVSTSVWS